MYQIKNKANVYNSQTIYHGKQYEHKHGSFQRIVYSNYFWLKCISISNELLGTVALLYEQMCNLNQILYHHNAMIITRKIQLSKFNHNLQVDLFKRTQYFDDLLHVANSDTFVFLNYKNDKEVLLLHCDIQGSTLFQHSFTRTQKCDYLKLTMTAQDQIVVTQRDHNKLTQINLTTHQVSYYCHEFIKLQNNYRIHYFSQSNLLCVEQKVYKSRRVNYIKLTYYCLPLSIGDKPFLCYKSQEKQFKCKMRTSKANNHSMIVWWNQSFGLTFTLHVFDLYDCPQGKYYNIQVRNYFIETVYVLDVWQKKTGEFLLACKNRGKYYSQSKIEIMKLKIAKKIFWKSQIKFSYSTNQQLKYSATLGNLSVVNVCHESKGQNNDHLIYINNQTQEIIETNHRLQRDEQFSYFLTGYDPNVIYKIIYSNRAVGGWKPRMVIQKQMFSIVEISLHFLLCLSQNLQEQLLQDALQLLDLLYDPNEQQQQKMQKIQQKPNKTQQSLQSSNSDQYPPSAQDNTEQL